MLAGGLVVGAAWAQDRTAASETVRLVIDYNDGVEKHFTALPWKAGVTVFDLLQEAKRHPHGIVLVCGPTGCGKTTWPPRPATSISYGPPTWSAGRSRRSRCSPRLWTAGSAMI